MVELNKEKILIISKQDTINDITLKIRGKRFLLIFIHKNNKDREEFKHKLIPHITLLGNKVGEIFEYE